MGFLKDAREQAKAQAEEKAQARRILDAPTAPAGVQYRVDTLRETLVGDRIDEGALADLLNRRAGEGWMFRQAVEVSVKGRVGPGGVSGLVVIFERPVPAVA